MIEALSGRCVLQKLYFESFNFSSVIGYNSAALLKFNSFIKSYFSRILPSFESRIFYLTGSSKNAYVVGQILIYW